MISEAKILEIFNEWKNFWKKDYLEREITNSVIKKVGKEVIDIIGVRRSGKSSLLALIIKKLKLNEKQILYINFEDPAFVNYCDIKLLDKIWEVYQENINSSLKPYLFFDEIQVIPQWEKWVRKIRDLELAHVFVTGSSSKLLSKEFGTTLTGRHISFKVFPLSFKEFIQFKGQKDINVITNKISLKRLFKKYLINSGFPEVVLTGNKQLLNNYFEDILYKDIVLRHEIRDVKLLKKIAGYLMTNVSKPMTYNSLKKVFKSSLDSVRTYLTYMEEAFLIFQVPLLSYSLKQQEIAPKKVYCIDNGLRNAVSFKFLKDEGKLAENLVFLELKRKGKEIYYWKDKNEVDFVIKEKNDTYSAINVTYTNEIDEREIKGLFEFKNKFKKKVKKLVILTKDIEKKENGIEFVSLWKWLLKS